MSTSVLIVDDHDVVRQGLRAVLEDAGGFTLTGEVGTAEEALALAVEARPDAAIVDLSLGAKSGLTLMGDLRERVPKTRVLVLTMHNDEAYLVESLRLGAMGYIVKGAPSAEVVKGLKAIAKGRPYFCSQLPKAMVKSAKAKARSPKSAAQLTAREGEVLRLAATGMTSRAIGDGLGISARTVESHRLHIRQKLGLKSRPDFIAYAMQHDLLAQ